MGNLFMYLECLLVNKVSRFSVMLFVLGFFLMRKYNWYFFPIVLFAIGGVLFFFTGFGLNSFLICKKMCRFIESYGYLAVSESDIDTPCSKAAYKVAIRKYNLTKM